jgi:hypothetical protein
MYETRRIDAHTLETFTLKYLYSSIMLTCMTKTRVNAYGCHVLLHIHKLKKTLKDKGLFKGKAAARCVLLI